MTVNAQIVISLKNQTSPEVRRLSGEFRDLIRTTTATGVSQELAERKALSHAQTLARLAVASGNAAQGERILSAALSQVDQKTDAAVRAQTQLANIQRGNANLAQQFATGLKSSLTSILGPAALATAAIGGIKAAFDAARDAFVLKAEIDQTNASIGVLLGGVRNTGQVFSQATSFAKQFKLTQQETSEAILASNQIIRQSKAPIDEVLSTLSRLRVLNPQEDFAGAARALSELNAGQITSIVTRFNLSRDAANAMKEEIRGGADVVQVVSKYLDTAGVSMDALKIRTEGAAGKMNELKVEAENFQLALAGQAGGPGLALLEARIALTRNATQLLSGDTKTLAGDFGGLVVATNPVAQVLAAVGFADDALISKFNTLAGTSIPSLFEPITISINAWKHYISVVTGIPEGVPGSDRVKDDLAEITRDAHTAADALAAVFAKPTAHIEDRSPQGGAIDVKGIGDRIAAGSSARVAELREGDQAAQRLQDALFDNRLKRAKDNAAKIALLREQQTKTTDPVERARIEGQIIDLQNQKTSSLSKQLSLNESIYDSINKQKNALLDIEELTIRDRQQDRDDLAKKKTALAILNSPNASADFKARAQDVLALIDVQDRQRAQQLAEKQATANAQIINGKVIQSKPGDGVLSPIPSGPASAAVPTAPAAGAPAAAAGGAQEVILVMTDAAGTVFARAAEPIIMDELLKGIRAVNAARGL